jgi:hypothetical protein
MKERRREVKRTNHNRSTDDSSNAIIHSDLFVGELELSYSCRVRFDVAQIAQMTQLQLWTSVFDVVRIVVAQSALTSVAFTSKRKFDDINFNESFKKRGSAPSIWHVEMNLN